jgi:hypothetical protein
LVFLAHFCKVTGCGLAVAAVVLEQDAAYWEVHVELPEAKSVEVMVGVTTKKDRKFYEAHIEGEGTFQTQFMCRCFSRYAHIVCE